MDKNQLKEKLEKAKEDYSNWINGETPSDFNKFMAQSEALTSKINNLEKQIREIDGPVYEVIPDFGDKMTLEDFIESCENGMFIDYDGSGYYATEDKMSNFPICPSDVIDDEVIEGYGFTHVVWFNK